METRDPKTKLLALTLVCPACGRDCKVPLEDAYDIPADEARANHSSTPLAAHEDKEKV